jgi:hypothetical protein
MQSPKPGWMEGIDWLTSFTKGPGSRQRDGIGEIDQVVRGWTLPRPFRPPVTVNRDPSGSGCRGIKHRNDPVRRLDLWRTSTTVRFGRSHPNAAAVWLCVLGRLSLLVISRQSHPHRADAQ